MENPEIPMDTEDSEPDSEHHCRNCDAVTVAGRPCRSCGGRA